MENTVIIKDFLEVKGMIEAARKASFQSVNVSLIHLYWRTGAFVSKRLQTAAWGDGVVELLANWLRQQGEHLKGFSKRGIYRMVQFYETYSSPEFQSEVTRLLAPQQGAKEEMRSSAMVQGKGANPQDGEKVSALLTQISWTNHNPSIGLLLGKEKDDAVVQYVLSRSASPALIAEYTRLLPDKEIVRQRMLELIGDEGI